MLSSKGNPGMDNTAIFGALRMRLGIDIKVQTVDLRKVA